VGGSEGGAKCRWERGCTRQKWEEDKQSPALARVEVRRGHGGRSRTALRFMHALHACSQLPANSETLAKAKFRLSLLIIISNIYSLVNPNVNLDLGLMHYATRSDAERSIRTWPGVAWLECWGTCLGGHS
jgi:hypothetical protein